MDEPSTGLDPASRNNLWSVVKEAKRNRAIILTSTELSLYSVYCFYSSIYTIMATDEVIFDSTLNGGGRSTM
jgi:ABC-type multidrug transport system ATPase subunit